MTDNTHLRKCYARYTASDAPEFLKWLDEQMQIMPENYDKLYEQFLKEKHAKGTNTIR